MKKEDLERLRSDINMLPNSHNLWPLETVREALKLGNAVYARLEPGDATRYEFLLTPFTPDGGTRTPQALAVVRMISGAPVGTVVIYAWQAGLGEYSLRTAALDLANGSEWSAMVFNWWLDLLSNGKR